MLPTVRVVLFDAVGTLIYPSPPVAEAYVRAGKAHGSRLEQAEIAERFHAAFAQAEQDDRRPGGERTSEERERRRWQWIVRTVFDDVAEQAALFETLWNHFAQAESWRLFDDASAVLTWLTTRGTTWGIASNFDARLHGIRRATSPLADCRQVFVSSELGYRKPASEFFTTIEERLNLRPHELLLVGDDLENDYLAAQAAGWQAVLVDRESQRPDCPDRIADLRELCDLLESRR